jgi:hypothetical protein
VYQYCNIRRLITFNPLLLIEGAYGTFASMLSAQQ